MTIEALMDEFAGLVGRALAGRWLKTQRPAPPADEAGGGSAEDGPRSASPGAITGLAPTDGPRTAPTGR